MYGRDRSLARPSSFNPSCGNANIPNDPDCLRFAARIPLQMTFTTFEVGLNSAVDVSSVASFGLARFDISPSQTTIGGQPVAVDAIEWMWTPDDAKWGGSAPIACSGARHCELYVIHSGTMSARAYTNGRMHEAAPMHVTVTDQLELTVDKASGPPNYPAIFTARNSDNTNVYIYTWEFAPDDSTPVIAVAGCPYGAQALKWDCPYRVPKSGTMKIKASVHYNHVDYAWAHVTVIPPKITLTASKTTLVAGDSATFTASGNGTSLVVQGWAFRPDSGVGGPATVGSSWGSCVPNNAQCTRVVPSSGTAFVIGTVDGVSSSDSVHVSVMVPSPSLTVAATADQVAEGDSVTFTGTVTPATATYQVVGWTWVPEGGVLASRAPSPSAGISTTPRSASSYPRASVASVDSTQQADSVWSNEGASPASMPPVPPTSACGGTALNCTVPVFQSGTMKLTIVSNGDTLVAGKGVYVHYECRPIYFSSLTIGPFPATRRLGGSFMDTATLDAPLVFSELYGQQNGIPTGKYVPNSGEESLGYELIQPSYVVLLCRTWRKQLPDGSDHWHGSEMPIYAGHHNLTFAFP